MTKIESVNIACCLKHNRLCRQHRNALAKNTFLSDLWTRITVDDLEPCLLEYLCRRAAISNVLKGTRTRRAPSILKRNFEQVNRNLLKLRKELRKQDIRATFDEEPDRSMNLDEYCSLLDTLQRTIEHKIIKNLKTAPHQSSLPNAAQRDMVLGVYALLHIKDKHFQLYRGELKRWVPELFVEFGDDNVDIHNLIRAVKRQLSTGEKYS